MREFSLRCLNFLYFEVIARRVMLGAPDLRDLALPACVHSPSEAKEPATAAGRADLSQLVPSSAASTCATRRVVPVSEWNTTSVCTRIFALRCCGRDEGFSSMDEVRLEREIVSLLVVLRALIEGAAFSPSPAARGTGRRRQGVKSPSPRTADRASPAHAISGIRQASRLRYRERWDNPARSPSPHA
jgi:hypothetical protein